MPKRHKYLDLARELKKKEAILVILVVIGALGKVPRDLKRRLDKFKSGGRIETIQAIALL